MTWLDLLLKGDKAEIKVLAGLPSHPEARLGRGLLLGFLMLLAEYSCRMTMLAASRPAMERESLLH